MAVFIQELDVDSSNFVAPTSRYSNSKVLLWSDKHILTFATFKRSTIPLSDSDKYTVITKSTEFRPDLVSQDAYGFPDFWWRILIANNMQDIFEFKVGTNIRVPQASL